MGVFDRFKRRPIARQPAPAPAPGEQMVIFEQLGMHCMGCRASVEAELQDVAGTRAVTVDLKQQSATVIFDPATTGLNTLRAAIDRAGYRPKAETVIEG